MHNGFASSLVVEMKEKQEKDLVLLQLEEDVHKRKVLAFAKGGDRVLRYKGRLCVPNVDDIRERIMAEAYHSRYSIHLGSTKIYHDSREVYWLSGMKRDIAELFPGAQIANKSRLSIKEHAEWLRTLMFQSGCGK